jgi:hypothetical protein
VFERTLFIDSALSFTPACPQGLPGAVPPNGKQSLAGLENFITVGLTYDMIVPKSTPLTRLAHWA